MRRKQKIKPLTKDQAMEEFFGWINGTNRKELVKAFVKHISDKGYVIEEKE